MLHVWRTHKVYTGVREWIERIYAPRREYIWRKLRLVMRSVGTGKTFVRENLAKGGKRHIKTWESFHIAWVSLTSYSHQCHQIIYRHQTVLYICKSDQWQTPIHNWWTYSATLSLDFSLLHFGQIPVIFAPETYLSCMPNTVKLRLTFK